MVDLQTHRIHTALALESGQAELEYELIWGMAEGEPPCMTYGARVTLSQPGYPKEIAEEPDISTDKEEVIQFLSRISMCGVTPMTLHDIVEDFIA